MPLRKLRQAHFRHAAGMALACAVAGFPLASAAFVVTIAPGVRALYLQVGVGTMTGGTYSTGGTPQNNAGINSVSVAVPAATVGTGSRPMTSDSPTANSPYSGSAFCTVPAQVYIGGFYRTPGAAANATLQVASPANLVNATGDTIAFGAISWVSGGLGDAVPTIPSGTFVGGSTQTLLTVTRNTWFESCLAFNYANNQLVPAGTFTGRATYTLTAP
ncbi:MAG: hypothetical protein H7346_05780 [Burkholderiaceae bacterium]|nr:hypothetical protein [Burkholderiaceae bacterium]